MKKLILLLSSIVLLSLMPTISFAEKTYSSVDIIERDGLWYIKANDKPMTGTVKDYWSNGDLFYKSTYKNGELISEEYF